VITKITGFDKKFFLIQPTEGSYNTQLCWVAKKPAFFVKSPAGRLKLVKPAFIGQNWQKF